MNECVSSSVIGATSIFERLAFAILCMSGALSINVPSRSKTIRAFIFVASLF